jgi:hypothetical protein
MSGGKNTSISHRALDELVKFKTSIVTDIGQFKTDVLKGIGDIVKAVGEVQDRHNDLAAHIVAVEGLAKNTASFAASEIGKLGGMSQHHFNELDQTVNAIDINVLALAEVSKEVIGQLTQVDSLIGRLHLAVDAALCATVPGSNHNNFRKALELAESDIYTIKVNAEKWYGDLVASAFKTVRERISAQDATRREKEAAAAQEAKEAAEKAAADEAEGKAVQAELQKANTDDLTVAAAISGGVGSPFPDGAEIFGG